MGFPNLDGKTRVCGLFGFPVEHSFSPAMHNAAFQNRGLNWAYLPFAVEPEHLAKAVQGITALNLAGVNITVPHKQRVIPLLDEIDPAAAQIGAVNTIVNNQGKLVGYNTDGAGFIKSLAEEANFEPRGKRVLLLGAGGAARAVAFSLAMAGCQAIYITNRTTETAKALARELSQKCGVAAEVLPWGLELPAAAVARVDLVVQTTSLGMWPNTQDCPEFPFGALHPGQLVCDLIYTPRQTAFLQQASARGATILNGLGMLLYQGVLAFELWTGHTAPVEVMKEILERQLNDSKLVERCENRKL